MACNKDNSSFEEGLWRVDLLEDALGKVESFDTPLYLEFINRQQYVLRLDVNTCGGEYYKSKGVKFQLGNCTEACCDSEEAIRLSKSLNRVSKFSENYRTILLKGDTDLIKLSKDD
jgi:hypothetical protein